MGYMEDFKTIDGAMELFKKVNGLGMQNNIFMAFKDTNREGMRYGMAGGMAAGLGVGIIKYSNAELEILRSNFDAILINRTENGLGFLPLHNKKMALTLKADNLEPSLEEYVFFQNDSIQQIKVKDFNILNKKVQTIKIKMDEKNTLHLMAKKQEKLIPYQEENFAKFMNDYKK